MIAITAEESLARATLVPRSGQFQKGAQDGLIDRIEYTLGALVDDFVSAPSRAGLFEVGAVAEVVMLGRDLPSGRRFAQLLGKAARRWSEDGLFEDVCFSEAHLTHHAMLLLQFAGPVRSDVLKALSSHALIGRSEWPTLTQLCINTLLAQYDIDLPFPETEIADLTAGIDKRCLRAESTEYDLALLLTTAQLLHDRQIAPSGLQLMAGVPRILPRVLLVQALRAGNWNWASVLAFLCHRVFGLPSYLDQALRGALDELPTTLEYFDLPKGIRDQSEYFSRSVRALRLRSAAALAMYLDCGHKE